MKKGLFNAAVNKNRRKVSGNKSAHVRFQPAPMSSLTVPAPPPASAKLPKKRNPVKSKKVVSKWDKAIRAAKYNLKRRW
jgi:hypothetical protein